MFCWYWSWRLSLTLGSLNGTSPWRKAQLCHDSCRERLKSLRYKPCLIYSSLVGLRCCLIRLLWLSERYFNDSMSAPKLMLKSMLFDWKFARDVTFIFRFTLKMSLSRWIELSFSYYIWLLCHIIWSFFFTCFLCSRLVCPSLCSRLIGLRVLGHNSFCSLVMLIKGPWSCQFLFLSHVD